MRFITCNQTGKEYEESFILNAIGDECMWCKSSIESLDDITEIVDDRPQVLCKVCNPD